MLAGAVSCVLYVTLTLNLLTTTIVAPPSNASKWQMGFNSAFKGLSIGKGKGKGIQFTLEQVTKAQKKSRDIVIGAR